MRHLTSWRILRSTLYWLVPCLIYLAVLADVAGHPGGLSWGKDLRATPDAEEYAMLALRLAHFQAPLLGLGLYDYPSRYPLAFPVLLAPAAVLLGGDATRLYLAPMLFGLVAVALMARAGRWLLGSRLAGGLAAAFFALHPQTARIASLTMSETAILMVFFLMLELARPWLDPARPEPSARRAALLGLALGWLTLAKAPYAYWALALASLAAARAWHRRAFAPLFALAASGGALALADLFYRRWAFGAWGMNGYAFWAPEYYTEFLKTFNFDYCHRTWNFLASADNLYAYGVMLRGKDGLFYGRVIPMLLSLAVPCLIWPERRGRPFTLPLLLLAGWGAVGALFCLTYFYQDARFFHLWVPLIDFAAAWVLVATPAWTPLRRGWLGRLHLRTWGRLAAATLAILIMRGQYLRFQADLQQTYQYQCPCYTDMIRPLLGQVPPGAWLFTNYKPVSVDLLRPNPGPTGSLYVNMIDAGYPLENVHTYAIDLFNLKPRRLRPDLAAEAAGMPQGWLNTPAQLIGLDTTWRLTPEERRAFFSHHAAYALVLRPPAPLDTTRLLDQTLIPLLKEGDLLKFHAIGRNQEATLYRIEVNASPGVTPLEPHKFPDIPARIMSK